MNKLYKPSCLLLLSLLIVLTLSFPAGPASAAATVITSSVQASFDLTAAKATALHAHG